MSEHKLGGWRPSEPDPRDYRLVYGAYEYAALPEEWELPAPGYIHDQGQVNSCAAHAMTAAMEGRGYPALAFGWLYGNRRHGTKYPGEGMISRDMLAAAQKDGVPELADYTADAEVREIIDLFEAEADKLLPIARKNCIGNYYRLETAEECRRALFEGKAVVLGLMLPESFAEVSAENPVAPVPEIGSDGRIGNLAGHMVEMAGWRKGQLKCQNSWGPEWGEGGNFYLPEEYFDIARQWGMPVVEAWAAELGKEPEKRETGWYQKDGKWRYRDADGSDHVGWLETWAWFYLDADGNMATSWQKIDGVWYYFNASGVMQTGWLYDGGKDVWYYLTNSGGMAVGWKKVEGKWYYFNGSGAMATGLQSITGKQYYFFERSQGGRLRGEMLRTDGAGAIV